MIPITPLVLTFNEAPNIGRTLAQLGWAKEVVVLDSFSTDDTLAIVKRFSNARVVQRKFDRFADQCNFGLNSCGISTDWVLSLDADYVLSDALVEEIKDLDPSEDVSAYWAKFKFAVHGRSLSGTLYPSVCVLFRKSMSSYSQDGHAHRLKVERGRILSLCAPIVHDDRKPLSRWLRSQERYVEEEVEKLLSTPRKQLSRADRIRMTPFLAPIVVAFYTLFIKRTLFDGRAGVEYASQRIIFELLLALRIVERRR